MKYKLLGNSGLRVSELFLGGMTIGNEWGWGTEKEESLKILKTYSEANGNFLDTSCNYQDGMSEKIIGEFINGDRDRYIIATKYSLHDHRYRNDINAGGNARKNLLRTVRDSLERLNTKYIDVLYVHMWDFSTGIPEIMKTLNDLVASTKVNYIAISDTPAWIVAKANTMAEHYGWEPFSIYQFPYSIVRRDAERDVIPYCKYHKMAMAAFGVLNSGLYTGKFTRPGMDNTGRLTKEEGFQAPERAITIAKEVDAIADEIGATSAQVATQWSRMIDPLLFPIVGATNAEQMAESLGSVEVTLTPDHMDRLDKLLREHYGFDHGFHRDWYRGTTHHFFGDRYDELIHHKEVY